jgi:hypothetical protein
MHKDKKEDLEKLLNFCKLSEEHLHNKREECANQVSML